MEIPRKAFSATWPLGKVIAAPLAAVNENVLWTVDSRSVGNVNIFTCVGSVKTILLAKSGDIWTLLTPAAPFGKTLWSWSFTNSVWNTASPCN